MHQTNWPPDVSDDEIRRMGPPENEIPVALQRNVVMARTDDVGLALLGLRVHSTGVLFDLIVRVRPSSSLVRGRGLGELTWEYGPGGARFLVGVELADGRRASSVPGVGSEDVSFDLVAGSSADLTIDQSWWLHPLPPEGSLHLVVRCPDLGIPETVTEVDATAIRQAAGRVVELWPWERPGWEEPEAAAPADLPGDSWFARR
ncbi:hypothetical protein [Geodermatophilus sabuli]|uniref:Uncharacterized protein n=1 Tax=Geodermatophilus sabuli TaxID=1564158 RepID=A0A285EDZ8_9ACTN|nr:hypothetical protein [Geodermatophilus sabuli]MBB3086413.1 hypothetical protein [Geodermatophilus sabuli]SNX97372.1 hypothetical protein SAMN06893097_10712 [Geodermatophilus sabuli]